MNRPMRIETICLFIWIAFLCSCVGGNRHVTNRSTYPIHQDLSTGNFQKALERCQDEYRQNPKDPRTLRQYLEAIEYIRTFADRSFQRDDLVLAGSTYALLLKCFPQFIPFADHLSFHRNDLIERIKVTQTRTIERKTESYLKAGNIQKAIDLYRSLYQQYPQDGVLQRDYLSLLELIKYHGDLAFERNDPVLSGCIYRTLLRNFGAFQSFSRSLSFQREGLDIQIQNCRKRLFDDGMEQYRSGNLTAAISIWKSILIFDPENQEVKRTLSTTLQQSKNLERDGKREAK